MQTVRIIGAGIAGSEAAWQCARRGTLVELYEMRPGVMPPAHRTGDFAELVCSSSLKSLDPGTSAGLLKLELAALGSLILESASAARLTGGTALMVDRARFSARVTREIRGHSNIDVISEPVSDLRALIGDGAPLIVAVGPNTTDDFQRNLDDFLGGERLYFFDATSPIVGADSIDTERAFEASRYAKGGDEGYLNIALSREEYLAFRNELLSAQVVPLGPGEDMKLFEGCLPVEELARRGEDTMRFGPLKPVGIADPATGFQPYAVVQLRQEDAMREAYSLVGFQTRLIYPEEERVFRTLPGLAEAKFIRFGRMHRNSYIDSPRLLFPTLQMRENQRLLFAGQITGLEGYQSAAATGLVAGINASRLASGQAAVEIPSHTVIGEALRWMADPGNKEYRPTAPVFGMWKDVPKLKKRERVQWYQEQSRGEIEKLSRYLEQALPDAK